MPRRGRFSVWLYWKKTTRQCLGSCAGELIPNVGSKARECAKAISLAFVLLDFQHAGVRRRA